MIGINGEKIFGVQRDAAELRIGRVGGRGESALRRAAHIVNLDLRALELTDVDKPIGTNGQRGRIIDGGFAHRAGAPGANQSQGLAESADTKRALSGDVDSAIGIHADVHGLTRARKGPRPELTMVHAVGKENDDGTMARVRDVDGRASVDGYIDRLKVHAIVLKGKTWLATGRKFMDVAGSGVRDIDDRFAVAGHSHGRIELARAIAVRAPSVNVLDGRRRRRRGGCLSRLRAG